MPPKIKYTFTSKERGAEISFYIYKGNSDSKNLRIARIKLNNLVTYPESYTLKEI